MKYSLLDTFLIWLGAPWLMFWIVVFMICLIGLTCAITRDRIQKTIKFIDPERSKETCRRIMVKYDDVFRRLAEVERKELIKARCLANSTRPRHSRSTLRKTR